MLLFLFDGEPEPTCVPRLQRPNFSDDVSSLRARQQQTNIETNLCPRTVRYIHSKRVLDIMSQFTFKTKMERAFQKRKGTHPGIRAGPTLRC